MPIGKIFIQAAIITLIITHLFGNLGSEPENNSDLNHIYQSSHEVLTDSLDPYVKYKSDKIAFIHAEVIDGSGDSVRTDQTLLISNGLIQAIGNNQEIVIPSDALIIDVRGKTIIPGLIGMHNHLHIPGFPFIGEIASKLYLASGVTTIQTAGAADASKELSLSNQIAQGKQIGPEIITSTPFITGPNGNPNMIIPRNEVHLRDTLQHWFAQGVSWVKVYRNIKPADLEIVIDEAHKSNVRVRGHLCSVTFQEASLMGIDGIEHGFNSSSDFRHGKEYGVCNGSREYIDELDIYSPEVKQLQQLMIDHGVTLTSTLAIYEASVPNRAYATQRTLDLMSPTLFNDYKERRQRFEATDDEVTREMRLKRIMAFEYQFFKMGGLLASGVDAGRHVLPGLGDQRNYQLFIEAGFTTEEAVQILTGNGAKALGRDDIGLLKAGKRADFVILRGDLKEEVTVIEHVETVFKAGIGYSPEHILSDVKGKFGLQ